jgi:hypothetical protein
MDKIVERVPGSFGPGRGAMAKKKGCHNQHPFKFLEVTG